MMLDAFCQYFRINVFVLFNLICIINGILESFNKTIIDF
jgi:hypothetical protein